MSQMTFGIRITAADDTRGGMRSAMQGVTSFTKALAKPILIPWKLAGAGLGFMRDINLGLRPLIDGLDSLIEKGTGLEVVRNAFEKLTGKSGAGADSLARRLVDASSGMMKMSEAMALANRAMGSGMTLDQLGVAIEFIGKKSIATGKDAKQSLDTVITGLIRGSTMFLDDFGILVDGVEGVKRAYTEIKGKGAWEALGPAAQKAETIRQALAEMSGQMSKLGITGKETVFIWAGFKNQIADVSDKLFAAIGRSDALRQSLIGFRDVLSGITRHFEGGGGMWELLTGKKKGDSGGLLGLGKAALLDTGELIGRGILGGLLKGLAAIGELLAKLGDWLKGLFTPISDALKSLSESLKPIADWIKNGIGMSAESLKKAGSWVADKLSGASAWLGKQFPEPITGPSPETPPGFPSLHEQITGLDYGWTGIKGRASAVKIGIQNLFAQAGAGLRMLDIALSIGGDAEDVENLKHHTDKMMEDRWLGWMKTYGQAPPTRSGPMPVGGQMSVNPMPLGVGFGIGMVMVSPSVIDDLTKAEVELGETRRKEAGSVRTLLTGGPRAISKLLDKWGNALLGGFDPFGRTKTWFGQFRKDFPPSNPIDVPTEPVQPDGLRFTRRGEDQRKGEIARLQREIDIIDAGGMGVRKEAWRRANEEARRIRGEGYTVSEAKLQRMFQDIWTELAKKMIELRTARIDELGGELREHGRRDGGGRDSEGIRGRWGRGRDDVGDQRGKTDSKIGEAAQQISSAVVQAVQAASVVAEELAGARMVLAGCGPRRA